MWEKSRCSILFHLLVPGGMWLMLICRPLSSENFCSSAFHSRVRYPLLPPASATAYSFLAFGYARLPIVFHQPRMLATANAAVSWSTPTLTRASLRLTSYTPYGIALRDLSAAK